jgi:6-phosphogluconolactonase
VTNAADDNVSVYRIGGNEALTPVPGSPFPGRGPTSVAVALLSRFVYVANTFSNNFSAYRIAENGALTPILGSPFAAGSLPRPWRWP